MNILFAGTPLFAAVQLQGLLDAGVNIQAVITQPDKPGKRGKKPVPSEVKEVALKAGLPVLQPEKLTSDDLSDFKPDLLIVVAYGQILRESLLNLPTYGCINVHASLLPRWRGAAPIQRAIEAGDPETGICIMQMDKGLDTGPVLLEKKIDISAGDTSQSLTEKLIPLGIEGLRETLQNIEADALSPIIQPEEGMTYARKVTKEEAKLDWNLDAVILKRKIRAFIPDPICYAMLGDMRVKFYEATVTAGKTGVSPGEVIDVSKQGVAIACGRETLLVKKLQLPIGKGSILNGSDILNSRRDILHAGVKFQ